MHAGLAEVRLARGIGLYFGTYAFELTAANIFEVLPFGRGRGGFVKIDRDLEAFRDFGSDVARHGDAVFDGDAINRDKGHDIGCSHARVRTLVFREIDQLGGLPYPANGGFLNGFTPADRSGERAVMVGIHLAVEEIDAG